MRARCMKKRFVFLLQRFSLVVQEREYSRVRGFHLVFQASVLREKTCIRTSDGACGFKWFKLFILGVSKIGIRR